MFVFVIPLTHATLNLVSIGLALAEAEFGSDFRVTAAALHDFGIYTAEKFYKGANKDEYLLVIISIEIELPMVTFALEVEEKINSIPAY